MTRKSKGKFKMKGHTLPGINQKSETVNLKDGKSPSSAFQQKSNDRRKELSILDKLKAARSAMSTSKGPFSDSNFMDRYRDEKRLIRKGTYRGDSFKTG